MGVKLGVTLDVMTVRNSNLCEREGLIVEETVRMEWWL